MVETVDSLQRVLHRFTAASVPKRGPEEAEIDPPSWRVSGEAICSTGFQRYSMLYIGEGCNRGAPSTPRAARTARASAAAKVAPCAVPSSSAAET